MQKNGVYNEEKILNAILKLGGQVNRFEDLLGSAGSLYTFKGVLVRGVIACLICTLVSGVTLIFVDKNWQEDLKVAFFFVFFTTAFVEASRFIIYKAYTKYFRKDFSDAALILSTAILAALGASLVFFAINKVGIYTIFINKPWPILALVGFVLAFMIMGIMVLYRRVFGNLKGTLSEIQQLYQSVLSVLSAAIEIKDTYTWGHSDRVSLFATALAIELGFSEKDVELIKEVAVFHDIGKIGIPESVLRKREPLTPEEWELIKDHPLMSAKILKPLKYLDEGVSIVRHHHERYDGKGYPDGLAGEKIPLGARIIALADSLDAMTSNRSYRQALSADEARKQIEEASGSQFDPRIVEIFRRLWSKKVFQQYLDNKEKQ